MKRLMLAAALCGTVMLASCGTAPAGTCDTMCTAEKGLTTAYATHDALVRLTIANHESGVLVGTNYATVKTYLDKAKSYLDLAYAANDAAAIVADVANANAAMASANATVGK